MERCDYCGKRLQNYPNGCDQPDCPHRGQAAPEPKGKEKAKPEPAPVTTAPLTQAELALIDEADSGGGWTTDSAGRW